MSNETTNAIRYKVKVGSKQLDIELLSRDNNRIVFKSSDQIYEVEVSREIRPLSLNSGLVISPITTQPNITHSKFDDSSITAPMPGLITKILVKEGDKITIGQTLIIIEAMKMENAINATRAGEIKKILIKEGQEVRSSQELILIS